MAPNLTITILNAEIQWSDASRSKGKYFFLLKILFQAKISIKCEDKIVLTQKGFLNEHLMHSFEGYASANKRVSQQREIHAFQAPTKWLEQRRQRKVQ